MKKAYLHNIKHGIANGYHIAIQCAEEGDILQKATTSYSLAKEGVESTGLVNILWCKRNDEDKWKIKANFLAILGESPEETIADYSCNEVADDWAKAYDRAIYSNHYEQ